MSILQRNVLSSLTFKVQFLLLVLTLVFSLWSWRLCLRRKVFKEVGLSVSENDLYTDFQKGGFWKGENIQGSTIEWQGDNTYVFFMVKSPEIYRFLCGSSAHGGPCLVNHCNWCFLHPFQSQKSFIDIFLSEPELKKLFEAELKLSFWADELCCRGRRWCWFCCWTKLFCTLEKFSSKSVEEVNRLSILFWRRTSLEGFGNNNN